MTSSEQMIRKQRFDKNDEIFKWIMAYVERVVPNRFLANDILRLMINYSVFQHTLFIPVTADDGDEKKKRLDNLALIIKKQTDQMHTGELEQCERAWAEYIAKKASSERQ